jgi:hypothetical protein
MDASTEGTLLPLPWSISEKMSRASTFERNLFVDLENLSGKVSVNFEFKAIFLNNRRAEFPVWVRTNQVTIA